MKLQFKLKPIPHLLIITSSDKYLIKSKTYANIIVIHKNNLNDKPVYEHELIHVRQFYRLFKLDFTLFNKCKREKEAYTEQMIVQLRLNNYDINSINIIQYANYIAKYCKDMELSDILHKLQIICNLEITRNNYKNLLDKGDN